MPDFTFQSRCRECVEDEASDETRKRLQDKRQTAKGKGGKQRVGQGAREARRFGAISRECAPTARLITSPHLRLDHGEIESIHEKEE